MSPENNEIKAVIFDWAGTVVDDGCFAPVTAFKEIFEKRGISLTNEEIREPMGLSKKEHMRKLFEIPRVVYHWSTQFHREPNEKDVIDLYEEFEPTLFEILPDFSKPIPGVTQVIGDLRNRGIKIGSTTGYTSDMIKIVSETSKQYGYEPDTVVTPDHFQEGRPYPWMCYQNALNLKVYPMSQMVKVGDTVNDMKEGINAGMWSVGVIKGGNELGLSTAQITEADSLQLNEKMKWISTKFYEAGTDFVIHEISELVGTIEKINAIMDSEKTSIEN